MIHITDRNFEENMKTKLFGWTLLFVLMLPTTPLFGKAQETNSTSPINPTRCDQAQCWLMKPIEFRYPLRMLLRRRRNQARCRLMKPTL